MEWWVWALIVIGVVLIGALKLYVWNKIKKRAASKRRFVDEA